MDNEREGLAMQENSVNAGNKRSGEPGERRIGLLEVVVAVVTYFAVQIASIVILPGASAIVTFSGPPGVLPGQGTNEGQ